MGWKETGRFHAGDGGSDGLGMRRQIPRWLCLVQAAPKATAGANPARVSAALRLIPHASVDSCLLPLGGVWRKLASAEGWTGFCPHKCPQGTPLAMEGPWKGTARATPRCVVSQPGFHRLTLVPSLWEEFH